MRIHTNTLLGQDVSLDELTENYEAVCLAVGATKAVNMPYPGSDLEGCILGVDFLKDHMTERHFSIGKKSPSLAAAIRRSTARELRFVKGPTRLSSIVVLAMRCQPSCTRLKLLS